MFLLDTNVISELRKLGTVRIDSAVSAWAGRSSGALCYLSAISVEEIEVGILRLQRRDPAQALVLRHWMDAHVLANFADRILAMDTQVARRSASPHFSPGTRMIAPESSCRAPCPQGGP